MKDSRYTLSNLVKAIQKPFLFLNEAERLVSKCIFRYKYGKGVDVMAEDWDNLIILDACRFDYFEECNSMDGNLQSVVSKGSHSREFIQSNFAGRELHETILVTANPFVELLDDDVFFRVCYDEIFEKWDEDLQTIPPEAVVDATLKMYKKYPNKRLIVHFMQPHAPYIGPTGRKIAKSQEFGVLHPNLEGYEVPEAGIPQAVEEGYVDESELRQAYRENVEIGLESAEKLIGELNGKSVITADHGEMFGEKVIFSNEYSHPYGTYTPELRIVPWFVVNDKERRTVVSGQPSGFKTLSDAKRDSRLEALGYV